MSKHNAHNEICEMFHLDPEKTSGKYEATIPILARNAHVIIEQQLGMNLDDDLVGTIFWCDGIEKKHPIILKPYNFIIQLLESEPLSASVTTTHVQEELQLVLGSSIPVPFKYAQHVNYKFLHKCFELRYVQHKDEWCLSDGITTIHPPVSCCQYTCNSVRSGTTLRTIDLLGSGTIKSMKATWGNNNKIHILSSPIITSVYQMKQDPVFQIQNPLISSIFENTPLFVSICGELCIGQEEFATINVHSLTLKIRPKKLEDNTLSYSNNRIVRHSMGVRVNAMFDSRCGAIKSLIVRIGSLPCNFTSAAEKGPDEFTLATPCKFLKQYKTFQELLHAFDICLNIYMFKAAAESWAAANITMKLNVSTMELYIFTRSNAEMMVIYWQLAMKQGVAQLIRNGIEHFDRLPNTWEMEFQSKMRTSSKYYNVTVTFS